RGAAEGGSGRKQEKARAAQADGRGPIRARARRAEAREEHAGQPAGITGGTASRPRVPARRRRLYTGSHRHLAGDEEAEGCRRGRLEAASVRILLVLRRLTTGGGGC